MIRKLENVFKMQTFTDENIMLSSVCLQMWNVPLSIAFKKSAPVALLQYEHSLKANDVKVLQEILLTLLIIWRFNYKVNYKKWALDLAAINFLDISTCYFFNQSTRVKGIYLLNSSLALICHFI